MSDKQVSTARLPRKEVTVMPNEFYDRPGEFYFPTNVHQIEELLGRLLTHIDALNLPDRASKANKDIMRQTVWSWWANVQENSLTSYKGVIAPLEVPPLVPEDD